MSTQSLPARSLRTGHSLLAVRLVRRVVNYLIYEAVLADHAGNFRLRSEFSPCSQGDAGGVRARRAMLGLRVA